VRNVSLVCFDAEDAEAAEAVYAKLLDAASLAVCGVPNDVEHDCDGGWVSSFGRARR